MHADHSDPSYFAETNFHRKQVRFGIRQTDRLHHLYAIGKSGVGKSTLLEVLIRQDIAAERGCALIDPHGDLAQRVYAYAEGVAPGRAIYLDAADMAQPYGYNPLRRVRYDKIPLAVSGFIETLRKLWPDAWGVRMEHVLRNSLYVLLEQPAATLLDILRLYTDDAFRTSVTRDLRNDVVRRFWQHEFENYPDRLKAEAVAPIQNKLGALLTDPRLHRILVTPQTDIRFRQIMDTGGILILNVAKGRLGEDAANVLGSLAVSTIGLAALSRAEDAPASRRPFFLFIDEFQSFTTLSTITMIPELRKYGVGLILAHQHLHQLEPEVRHAVLGNVGSFVLFRVGAEDAKILSAEFQPRFAPADMIELPNRSMYVKMMINGTPSVPFSATGIVCK